MRRGLFISLSLHAAILIWAVVSFSFARELESLDSQPIPIEIVTPADISKMKAGKKDAEKKVAAVEKPPEEPKPVKKEAKKEEVRPKRVSAPPPPPKPSADAEPAPKPLEKKAQPKPEPTPEKKPEAAAEKTAALPMPSRRPPPPSVSKPLKQETKVAAKTPAKKPDFNADSIAALLDKRPDAAAKPFPEQNKDHLLKPPEPTQGLARGQDQQMTLSEIDALRARISQCWNPPVGGLGSDAIRVKLRLQLTEDGMLSERPQVVNRDGSPFFTAAADSAVRAVMLCQPYSLPGAKYALWRDMILNFDPREMFGG